MSQTREIKRKWLRSPSIGEARVYRELKTAITSGLLKPGSLLIQEELCRQFRVSRTPIRDALTHLQAEGLVVALPNKGVVVRELSAKDVYDLYEVRLLLESAAARAAAGKANQEELKAILAEVLPLTQRRNLSFEWVRKTGSKLHRLIVAFSGNRIMRDILDRIGALIDLSRIPFRESSDRLEQINREHIEMIQALLKGDGELAADLMRTHLSLSREAHLKLLMESTYDEVSIGS